MRLSQFPVKKFRCIACLMFLHLPLFAAPQWYSLGLTDRAVHCLLADDTSAIIAGTDSGVSVLFNAAWYHLKMLPVTAIVRVSPSVVAVAAGNGSWSDGVYIGRNILNGPPFYSFAIGDWFINPTALAAGPAVSRAASAADLPYVLYVGGKNSFARGVIYKDSLSKLNPVPMPAYSFGVEDPFCSSLQIFNNQPFAGGYDRSPVPGPSYLLNYNFQDSLHKIRPMKTTAVTEGRFTSLIGLTSRSLAIADLDSGVFFYSPGMNEPWHRIAGPSDNPIISLYSGKTSMANIDAMLYAANKDGVFLYFPADGDDSFPVWIKLGALSAEPLYLTGMGSDGDLLAATVKGVYRYGEKGTGANPPPRGAACAASKVTKRISIYGLAPQAAVKSWFDLHGRSLGHQQAAGIKAAGVVVSGLR